MNQTETVPHILPIKILLALIALILGCLLVGYEYLMLQWPMMREAHFLHYIAYLINEHNFAPYRDVLETSWFGTFLFHMAIGKLFGYTSTAFRSADIVFLASLLFLTWKILRRLDFWLAWVGCLSFGLTYLHYGPANTLQRDYVLLLPIAAALLVALQTDWHSELRALLIGICFGAAASIKPHAIIGLPVILTLLYSQSGAERSIFRSLFYCGLGGAGTMGVGLLWLWYRNGLDAFIDMTLHYLPLYQELNGAHEMSTRTERWQNTLRWWKYFLWIWPYAIAVATAYGCYNTEKKSQQRAIIISLATLAMCYNLYPLISGKFWDYHWIPYSYFSVLSTSILLFPPSRATWRNSLLSCCMILFFLYSLSGQYVPWQGLQNQIKNYPDIHIDQQFEADVADFIKQRLLPGDTIQIIEQGGPSTLYLLQADAVLATPYLGSFMFLHHIHEPYVQQAQQDFLQRLQEKPPKLFLVMTDFTRPSGINTITEIPGLKDFLNMHYQVEWKHPAFTIWKYREDPVNPQE
ncbi:MAG TPA: hypothetical protein VLB90_08810 [Pseudomonadales bacterium]|nr:hypothetical protein [Pseudomonadales bacterium]